MFWRKAMQSIYPQISQNLTLILIHILFYKHVTLSGFFTNPITNKITTTISNFPTRQPLDNAQQTTRLQISKTPL